MNIMKRTDNFDVCTNGTLSLSNNECTNNLATETGDQSNFEGTAENIVVAQIITMESESLVL